jgi:hypothetical protein
MGVNLVFPLDFAPCLKRWGCPQNVTRTAIQLKVDQLGAVYTSLGHVTADIEAASSEVKMLEEAVKTELLEGWVQEYLLGPKEKVLSDLITAKDKYVKDITRMRNQFAEQTMPAAKEGEERYDAAFFDQISMDGGKRGLAKINAIVSGLLEKLPEARSDGFKAARQQEGKPVGVLQQEGLHEALKMYAAVEVSLEDGGFHRDDLKGSSVCPNTKNASRAFEKVYARWDGDFRAVTDWGRATVCGGTLEILARAIAVTMTALSGLGYVVVAAKNLLDEAKNVAANGGYRNMMVNLQCPESKHVVELQFTLSPIEKVKHSQFGHVVFELLRRCGFSSKNSVVYGGWTESMGDAIRAGRAVELNCEEAMWNVEDAGKLKSALMLPSCRVSKVNCSSSAGDGVFAMVDAVCACATVKYIQ